jgi:two-component system response regulator HydG
VQRAYIMAEQEIDASTLPAELGAPVVSVGAGPAADGAPVLKVGTSLSEAERHLILATLDHYGGDKKKTAEVLGISLKTLYNRLNVYKRE